MAPAVRHRAGFLIPSSNTMIETEYRSAFPTEVSLHYARLGMTQLTDEGIRQQDAEIGPQAAGLGSAKVDLVVFCQTVVSLVRGMAFDRELAAKIETASGAPALTAAAAMVDALKTLGVTRLAIGSPFPPEANRNSIGFLEENGFGVVASEGLGIVDNFSIALVPPSDVVELALRADRPEAEAIIVPGGNLPCLAAIAEIEERIGKPVVTTNQSTMWAVLKRLGGYGAVSGFGTLLAAHL